MNEYLNFYFFVGVGASNKQAEMFNRSLNLHVEFHLNRNLSLQNPGNEEVMLIVSGISENGEPSLKDATVYRAC